MPAPGPKGSSGGGDAKEVAKERASDVGASAKEQAGELGDEARRQAGELAGRAKSATKQQVEQQGDQLASLAESAASELRSMAKAASDDSFIGTLVGEAAERIDSVAGRYRSGGLEGVGDDLRRFARRSPASFLGSTFVAGVLAGRVVRNADNERLKRAVAPGSDPDDAPTASSSSPAPAREPAPSGATPSGRRPTTTPAPTGTLPPPDPSRPTGKVRP